MAQPALADHPIGLLLGATACLRAGFGLTAPALNSFTSRTGLFIGYLVGAVIMMLGGVVELLIGINAEGKSLEAVTEPLTAADRTSTLRPAPTTTAAEA